LENWQYSGGQASEGQGGFYGSGGARHLPPQGAVGDDRHLMMALAADVQKIQQVMSELEVLQSLLRNEDESHVSSKSIEIKTSIKKLMTDSQVLESLNRLELEGQPVWGLSTEEREMIMLARETVNDC
jgi:glutamine amidotransferase PdxT